MAEIQSNPEYDKRCLSILDSLNRVSHSINLGLKYDPSAILRISNKKYEVSKYAEKEINSFNFSDKFFNLPKISEIEYDQEEIENSERAIKKKIEEKNTNENKNEFEVKTNYTFDVDFEKPIFNEKMKEKIIRNSEKKIFKKEKIDYQACNKIEYDFNNDDPCEMETDRYEIFKKYKNENLFFNEMYSKDNIMDICDMIGKEFEKNDYTIIKEDENENKNKTNLTFLGNKIDLENDTLIDQTSVKDINKDDTNMQIDHSNNSKFRKVKNIKNRKFHE